MPSRNNYYCDGTDRGAIRSNGRCSVCGQPPTPDGYDPSLMGSSAHLYDGLSMEEIVVGCAAFTGMAVASATDAQLLDWARRTEGEPRRNEIGLDGRALAREMVKREVAKRGLFINDGPFAGT